MFDRQKVEAILKAITDLNLSMGIWAVVIPAVFALTVVLLLLNAYRNPGRRSSRALLGSLAVIYLYSGFTILMGADRMGSTMALIGASMLWMVGALLLIDIICHWTVIRYPKKRDLKIVSLLLMTSGIFLYPVLEMILGFTWPRMVLFGAECPTTIFLIGLLVGSIPHVNRPLLVIASLNAMITGFSVAMNGASFDYLYACAGVLGTIIMVMHFREIFSRGTLRS
jgi:hypothetical protein